jgi:peptidoglycan/LPS O-acetylase OafA/YrhL
MKLPKALELEPLDNRYPALHGIRVLGIVSVVQYHVTSLVVGEEGVDLSGWSMLSTSVFFGMDLFFILSGFLIGSILIRSFEKHGTVDARRFYIRRIARTFPSYYVVLTFLALTCTLTASQARNLPWEYVYGTDFLPVRRAGTLMYWGWSLALEEQFYLLVPLLFYVLYRLRTDRAKVLLLVAIWASALLVRVSIYRASGPWTPEALWLALYTKLYTRFDTLIAGILLAFVHDRYGTRLDAWLRNARARATLDLTALVCLAALLLRDPEEPIGRLLSWGTITSIMYFSLLVRLLHGEGGFRRALGAPVFRKIATLGYGVYLVHIPIYVYGLVPIVRKLAARGVTMALLWPSSLVVLLALSLALAYVLHVVIEKPALRLRERFAA